MQISKTVGVQNIVNGLEIVRMRNALCVDRHAVNLKSLRLKYLNKTVRAYCLLSNEITNVKHSMKMMIYLEELAKKTITKNYDCSIKKIHDPP